MKDLKSNYKFDWVLINELAIGKAPKKYSDLQLIKSKGIISILSLCSISEAKPPEELDKMFIAKRVVIPDHKYERELTLNEINNVLDILSELLNNGPVLVHCVAAVERSPLICMGWLIRNKDLSPQEALDYLMQVHPGTSPLSININLLNSISKNL